MAQSGLAIDPSATGATPQGAEIATRSAFSAFAAAESAGSNLATDPGQTVPTTGNASAGSPLALGGQAAASAPDPLSGTSGNGPGGVAGQAVAATVPTPGAAADLAAIGPGSPLTASLTIAPDGTASRDFLVLAPGFYSISGVQDPGQLTILAEDGPGSPRSIVFVPATEPGAQETFLEAGIYRIGLAGLDPSIGPQSVTIRAKSDASESLLGEGVGQVPALGTRLLASSAAGSPGSASGSRAVADPTATTSTASNLTPGRQVYSTTVAVGSPTGGIRLVVFGQPAGRPSGLADRISVVGTSVGQGSVALAFHGSDLPGGLGGPFASIRSDRNPGFAAGPRTFDAKISLAEGPIAPPARPGAADDGADPAIDRDGQPDLEPALVAGETAPPEAEVAEARGRADRTAELEADATIGDLAPIGWTLGLISAIAAGVQYRRHLQARARLAVVPLSIRPIYRGPHRRARTARFMRNCSA